MIIRNDNITEASLGISVTDPNAQAYINRLLSVETISNETAGYINDFFVALKSNNLYSKIKLMWPMIGTSKSSLLLEASGNYKVGSFWLDLFYNGNGTTQFTSNGINSYDEWWALFVSDAEGSAAPGASYQWRTILPNVDDAHLSVYSRTNRGQNDGYAFAGTGGGSNNQAELYLNQNGDLGLRAGFGQVAAAIDDAAFTSTQGFFVSTRTSSTDMRVFLNGSQVAISEEDNSGGTLPDNRISFLTGDAIEACFASVGLGMTPTDAVNYYTIVNDLQTKLGRQN